MSSIPVDERSCLGLLEVPGVPMFSEPRGWMHGEQVVRPMVELLEESMDIEFHLWLLLNYQDRQANLGFVCVRCRVAWVGEPTCWVCAKRGLA